jgi:hypothetical protein
MAVRSSVNVIVSSSSEHVQMQYKTVSYMVLKQKILYNSLYIMEYL